MPLAFCNAMAVFDIRRLQAREPEMRITRLLGLSAVGAIAFGAGVVGVAPQAEATLQLASVVNGGNLFCAATDPLCNTAFPATNTRTWLRER